MPPAINNSSAWEPLGWIIIFFRLYFGYKNDRRNLTFPHFLNVVKMSADKLSPDVDSRSKLSGRKVNYGWKKKKADVVTWQNQYVSCRGQNLKRSQIRLRLSWQRYASASDPRARNGARSFQIPTLSRKKKLFFAIIQSSKNEYCVIFD